MSEPQYPLSPPPAEPPHVPAIARIAALEQRIADHEDMLNQLMARHNKFVNDVSAELGL